MVVTTFGFFLGSNGEHTESHGGVYL